MSKKRGAARRTAAALSVAAVLVMSSGLALIVAAPAQAKTPVNICHATSSDSNPYVFITVDDDSAKFQGHLAHHNTPNKRWKTAGTFNGQPHAAGAPKPDLIGDYTDDGGTPHTFGDGVINAESCAAEVAEIETTASATFVDPTCDNENTASYSTEGEHATFAIEGTVAPGEAVTVTATVEDGYVFADDAQTLTFEHTFTKAADCSTTEPPVVEPPVVEPPDDTSVATPTPTVVHAGLVSTVGGDERMQQGLALLLVGMIMLVMAGGLGWVQPYGGKSQN